MIQIDILLSGTFIIIFPLLVYKIVLGSLCLCTVLRRNDLPWFLDCLVRPFSSY